MTIQLTIALYLGGVVADAGSEHTLAEDVESALIFEGKATRVGAAPDQAGPVSLTSDNHQAAHIAMGTWDDLNFNAAGINPPGSADSATRDPITGMILFAGNTDNVLAACAQMPHSWIQGSEVRPHIHLRFPTAATANTRWKFEYDLANVNGEFVNAYGTYTLLGIITVANPNNAKKSVVANLGAIDMTGLTVSAQIPWKLTRLSNSDAADNHNADVVLTDIDFHYQKDTPGSRQEYVK